MAETVRASGEIWGLFGHRFALDGADGKALVDLGPAGIRGLDLKAGDTVTVVGRRKPTEIKVTGITLPDGTERAIAWPDKHPAADPGPALAAARAAGYEILGDPRRKPKHFEIDVRRDGQTSELHVEMDGRIRKSRPKKLGGSQFPRMG